MKINIDRIPPQGIEVEEDIGEKDLRLDVEEMSVPAPLRARAWVSRITNALHVELDLDGYVSLTCARCLNEFKKRVDKHLKLDYAVEPGQHELDLDPDIREELILDFEIKNLCKPDCKGLCVSCGANLNEGKCRCQINK